MRVKINNFEAQALELAINIAVDSGQISSDVEKSLLNVRDKIEHEIDLVNLSAKNINTTVNKKD